MYFSSTDRRLLRTTVSDPRPELVNEPRPKSGVVDKSKLQACGAEEKYIAIESSVVNLHSHSRSGLGKLGIKGQTFGEFCTPPLPVFFFSL